MYRYSKRGETEGQALVETALLLLFLLLLLMGIIEFGFIFYGYVRVSNATREGARAGSLWLMNREPKPGGGYQRTLGETVREAVQAEFSAVPEGDIDVQPPDPADPQPGDPITVTVTYNYPMPIASGLPIVSDIIGPNFPMSRTVVMLFQ